MRTFTVTMLLLAIASGSACAQELKIGGQIRPRTELRNATGVNDVVSTMRTRVQLTSDLAATARVFLQVQDVRTFGEETSTMTSLNHIDLHQGFIEFGNTRTSWNARIGRQEASFDEERLVGNADWVQQGRGFDGARLGWQRGRTTLDIIAFEVSDASVRGKTADERFLAAHTTFKFQKYANVDAYLFQNHVSGASVTNQNTFGARLSGVYGIWSYRFEPAVQRGTRRGTSVNAYLFAARVTASVSHAMAQFTAWLDQLSGDDEATYATTKAFDTVFGTNHKFYGIADIFTNIPLHTANRGLQDWSLKSSCQVMSAIGINADVHQFNATAARGLSSARLGREADVFATFKYSPRLTVAGGAARYVRGQAMSELNLTARSQNFSYLMLSAAF